MNGIDTMSTGMVASSKTSSANDRRFEMGRQSSMKSVVFLKKDGLVQGFLPVGRDFLSSIEKISEAKIAFSPMKWISCLLEGLGRRR